MTLGTLYYQAEAGEPNSTRVLVPLSIIKHFELDIELSGPDQFYPSEYYQRVVPCFRFEDGTPLGESIPINLWLLEQVDNYGGLLGDGSEKVRALVIQWMLFFNYELMVQTVPLRLMKIGRYPFDRAQYDASLNKLRTEILPYLERRLGATGYVVGETTSLADLYGVQMLFRPLSSFFDKTWRSQFPLIWAWWSTVSKHPVWDGYWDTFVPVDTAPFPGE